MARRQEPVNAVPRSLSAVAAAGDRAATLRTLRDALAATWEDASPRERPAIAGQLRAVLLELESLPSGQASVSDDLAERRRSRRAAAKGGASARGRGGDVGQGSG